MQRAKSLTRPERRPITGRSRQQGETYDAEDMGGADAFGAIPQKRKRRKMDCDPWVAFSRFVTCCIPDTLISKCGVGNIEAWREKIALCCIIAIMNGLVAYITFGLNNALCSGVVKEKFPAFVVDQTTVPPTATKSFLDPRFVVIWGQVYNFKDVQREVSAKQGVQLSNNLGGQDLSKIFTLDPATSPCRPAACPDCERRLKLKECTLPGFNGNTCLRRDQLQLQPLGVVSFEWEDLLRGELMTFNGHVMNMTDYLASTSEQSVPPGDRWYIVDSTIRRNLRLDSTISMLSTAETARAAACMETSHLVIGNLGKQTVGCGAATVILTATLVVVVSIILTRFLMAVTFSWFLSKGMINISKSGRRTIQHRDSNSTFVEPGIDAVEPNPLNEVGDPLTYTLMLVTCYSEGEAGLRCTLESLAETTYDDKYKMFFIIADGIIQGAGEEKSTPDICLSMLDIAPDMRDPKPCSYVAIADGQKQHNMAKVYAGHFRHNGHDVPAILVVKCGTPSEANMPKPGNRGKRDSQVLLMHFLSRVIFNDRLTELDYDLFQKVHYITGVNPNHFELVLMVDADTKVLPSSLSFMVKAMDKDPMIMGLCGETRIANKYDSWVTYIQVFEYYIAHHLGKAFESVFGGVTCLPGCFSMYRIKARKNGAWVPILANPDIVQEYCQNVVDTLHKKNLLLLGEDRFLSTLMLRNFPKRQMVFVPQAQCKTVVPDTFSVLLSQRRRWINSTVHNLLELVLVKDLCGIACLSMQFVVMMELIGTVVLPGSIAFTIVLIVSLAVNFNESQMIPLAMLLAVLGLPAILILLTTRKMVYVGWMVVYILALPIWNFVLPVYAFWHFDDFSWGQTRMVAGEGKQDGSHGEKEGEFDTSAIVMRTWAEWERERRIPNGAPRALVH